MPTPIDRLRAVFGFDPRSLALFRISLGTLLLFDLVLRSFDLETFYTDAGVLPREHWASLTHRWHWSLHGASGEPWWQILLFVIAGIAAIALAIGYRTKIANAISFVLLASLLNRNGLVLQGGDQLLAVMCFWALFLPLGLRFSVDAALQPTLRDDPNSRQLDSAAHRPWLSVATVAITFQILYLYFFTALMKTGAAWTERFDAAFYAVSLQHFATPIGDFMTGFPTLLKAATAYVLGVEFVGPLLVLGAVLWPVSRQFYRVFAISRLTGLVLLGSLHAAFLLMLYIGLFPLIDFMALSLLIPGIAWGWLATRRTDSDALAAGVTMHYDRDCGFCLKMCLILREFLLPPQARIVPAQDDPEIGALLERENSWVVTDHTGKPHLHWHAMALVFRQRWPFKPLGWLMSVPPFLQIGNAIYGVVQRYRSHLSNITATALPWRRVPVRPGIAGGIVAAYFFYVVTAFNIWEMPGLRGKMPAHVEHAARIARIDQRWDMFAPFPLTTSMYPLVSGTLRDGEKVDLYDLTSSAADWQEPYRLYPLYPSYRWRKYLGRVDSHRDNTVRRAFGEYLCHAWNRPGRERDRQLGILEVRFVKLSTNTQGVEKKRSSRTVWRHWCYPEFKPN